MVLICFCKLCSNWIAAGPDTTLYVRYIFLFTELESFKDLNALRGIKMVLWNIRSLYPKFPALEASLDGVALDLLCLCETWLNASVHDNLISLPGFNLYRFDRLTGRRGGGLCMYVNPTQSV